MGNLTFKAVWCTWGAIPQVPKPGQREREREPLSWVSYPRLSLPCSPLKIWGLPPLSPCPLTLASGPKGYLLGGRARRPPSDTCYWSLDFPLSPSIPAACKSLILGPLPAPPLSRTSLLPPSLPPGLQGGTGAHRRGEGVRVASGIWEFWPRAVTWSPGILSLKTQVHICTW